MRAFAHTLAICVALCPCAAPAQAQQSYPTRPIRFIVAQPPGGGTDIVARMLAPPLGAQLRQQVIVDNRPGAGGIVGTELAARAPADGYTILLGYTGNLTINPHLHMNLPYRPVEDFEPVSLAVASPLVLAIHAGTGVATVSELLRYAKTRTAPLNYATPGNGSLHHLAMVWLKSETGLDMTHVPYKGNQSTIAVISGEVSVAFVSVLSALPHIKAGRMKVIAVSSKNRSRVLPELPTIAESGIRDFEATNWFGVVAPRGTPGPVVSKLSGLIAAYIATAEARERILNGGADPVGSTPAEFASVIRTELKRWGAVVKTAGLKVE